MPGVAGYQGQDDEASLADRGQAAQRRVLFEEALLLRGAGLAVVDDDDDLRIAGDHAFPVDLGQLAATSSVTLRPPAASISACGICPGGQR